jgi:hypothetical protein
MMPVETRDESLNRSGVRGPKNDSKKKMDLQLTKLSRCGKSWIACNPRQFIVSLSGRGERKREGQKM